MRRRLRDEAGMTLMEVMVAATIGMVVLLSVFAMLDTNVRLHAGTMSKTDAMQRGRLAMDAMTQELRSQVCLADLTPAVAPESTGTSVEFYNDFSAGDGAQPPTKRRLSIDPATGDIKSEIFTATVPEPGADQFTDQATRVELRLENAALQTEPDPAWIPVPNTPRPTREVPLFRYYAYKWVGDPKRAEAIEQLPVPLSDENARRVARIDVAFVSRPTAAKDNGHAVALTDQVMARHSDPNLAKWDPDNPSLPDPRCV